MFGQSGSSPFDLRWRLFGISFCIRPSFWIFNLIFGLAFWGRGLNFFITWVLCELASFLIHELAHVLVGRMFGFRGGIVIGAFGGQPSGDRETMARWQRILFYAAGPVASLGIWAGAWAYLIYGNPVQLGNAEMPVRRIMFCLIQFNLFWGLLNTLPIYPLDGGMIMRDLCGAVLPPKAGIVLSLLISFLCAGGMAAYSAYALWKVPAPWHWSASPGFSLVFDALLAVESLILLVGAIREPSRKEAAEKEADESSDLDQPAARQETYDDYRPFDGGRPYDTEKR